MASPFFQSYILTIKDGRVFQWIGKAETFERGKHQAWAAVLHHTGQPAWDSAAYPLDTSDSSLAEGLRELVPAS